MIVPMKRQRIILWGMAVAILFLLSCCCSTKDKGEKVCIGIAWRADTDSEFCQNVVRSLKEAGAEVVLLPQVKADAFDYDGEILDEKYYDEHSILLQPYADMVKSETASNAAEAVKGIDAIVFSGGEDISTTLFLHPVPWHGIPEEEDYNPTRDISDYLLMAYAIRNDIPVLGLCRGMQMLGVLSGATVIQDIPVHFSEQGKTYNYEHRNQKPADGYRDYASHVVNVTDTNSLLYEITGTQVIAGVPSWHHQAIGSVDGTPLSVTATTTTDGISIIEACERKDKSFVLGVQYHPEVAVVKNLDKKANASDYISYEEGLAYFQALVSQAKGKRTAR